MTSSIDVTKPNAGAARTEYIRDNFVIIKAEIEELQTHRHFKGVHATLIDLQTAYPTGAMGDYAQVDSGAGISAQNYIWEVQDGWVLSSASGSGALNTDGLPEVFTSPTVGQLLRY